MFISLLSNWGKNKSTTYDKDSVFLSNWCEKRESVSVKWLDNNRSSAFSAWWRSMLRIYQISDKNETRFLVLGIWVNNLGKISFLKLNELVCFRNWRQRTALSLKGQT